MAKGAVLTFANDVRAAARRAFWSRDKPGDDTSNDTWRTLRFGTSLTGMEVNEFSAMQLTAVYACIRAISESIASLPVQVYRKLPDGKGQEIASNHPLYYLLHNAPNSKMTSFEWRETKQAHLLSWGNTYSQIIRNGYGNVHSLYPLKPDRVKPYLNDNGELEYEYRQEIKGPARFKIVTLSQDDVLHIPGLGFDGLIGYSPIQMAAKALGLAMATEEFGSQFFGNGAIPSGILKFHDDKTRTQVDEAQKIWEEKYGGKNRNKIAVIGGGAEFKTVTIPPDQAQFLETRRFQLNEIARIFRMPPHMIGDLEKSSFNNIEQMSLEFVMYTLEPWALRWEQALEMALLRPEERQYYTIRLNLDGLLRGDYKTRMEGYRIGISNGFLSPNDVRKLENMNPIQNGDVYMVNGSMVRIEDVGAAYRGEAAAAWEAYKRNLLDTPNLPEWPKD